MHLRSARRAAGAMQLQRCTPSTCLRHALCARAKDEHVILPNLLRNLDVGAVLRTGQQCEWRCRLHANAARSRTASPSSYQVNACQRLAGQPLAASPGCRRTMVPMISAPFMANFMLPVPLASVPAVEMCWLRSGRVRGNPENVPQQGQLAASAYCCACILSSALSTSRSIPAGCAPHLSSVPGMMVSATDTL